MWSIGDPLILWRVKYAPPPSVILPNLVILDQTVRMYLKGSVKETNKFHIYETEEITRKASDAAEYIELFGSFTRDRHARHI